MPDIRISRRTDRPPTEVWSLVTDWERHGASVPLTRTTVTPPGPSRVGTVFTARTGVGRLSFADPMEIVRWDPPREGAPGVVRLVKRGRIVRGWARIEVRPGWVLWREEISLPGLGWADPLISFAGRRLFARALDRVLGAAQAPGGRSVAR
ncbi:SRPBCC family protein [Streptomyces sp. BI20]|uniref:SRPBCC family protein n=1 Tax=Streptomyces sp. BI20 TaxID=3403460 RepID=UPI003C734DA3